MTTSSADGTGQHAPRRRRSVEELAREKGVRPIRSMDDMARPELFETDEELDAFIAHVYASRRANLA